MTLRVRALAALLLALVAMAPGGAPARAASVDAPERAGDVLVLDALNRARGLDHAGSDTKFTLRLTNDATCPGDSENDQWRIQSFLIPEQDDPTAIRYKPPFGPSGEGQWFLARDRSTPFMFEFTAPNQAAGSSGQIPAFPPFSFRAVEYKKLTPGTYRLGVACTLDFKTAKYWDTTVVVEPDATDKPNGFTWRLAAAQHGVRGVRFPATRTLVIAGLVLASLVFWLASRPRRRSPLSKESR